MADSEPSPPELLIIDIPLLDYDAVRPLTPRPATKREKREFEAQRKEPQKKPTDTQELTRE